MRYVTRASIGAAIPAHTLQQLSQDDPAVDIPDEAVIDRIIQEVEDLIDGYMRGRYTLPFDPVPTILQGAAVHLIRYELYARRPEGGIPDMVADARKNTIKLLETIRDGLVTLGIPATGENAREPGEIRVRSRRQVFGNRTWEHY